MITYKVKVAGNGTKRWFNEDGLRHRIDGPAYEGSDGLKMWYVNGKIHRLDGPAIEFAHGGKFWFIEGEEYTEEKFRAKIDAMNRPCKGKKIVVDGVEYTLI
jgi:hypothetical protein